MLENKLELALVQVQEMQQEREHFEHQIAFQQTAANTLEARALREHIEQLEVRPIIIVLSCLLQDMGIYAAWCVSLADGQPRIGYVLKPTS
jgi:hypothetical protein